MNCKRFENKIALLVGGDLPPRHAPRVETHLARCASCREFADQLRESHAAVRALGQDDVDESLCRELRERVLAQTLDDPRGQRKPAATPGKRFRLAAAMATCGVLILVLAAAYLAMRSQPDQPAAPMVAETPKAPAQVTPDAPAAVVVERAQVQAEVQRAPAPAPEPVVVKLYTDDPRVVFFLVADNKGGKDS